LNIQCENNSDLTYLYMETDVLAIRS